MPRTTTMAAAAALLALGASAFAPAPAPHEETTTTVHRFGDPCGADGDVVAFQTFVTGDRMPEVDICAFEATATVDADGTLVGLALALEVDGDVDPGPGRAYTVRLESVPAEGDASSRACTLEVSLFGRTGDPEARGGLTSCGESNLYWFGLDDAKRLPELAYGGAAAPAVTWEVDGGRVEFTFDLAVPNPSLAALLESASGSLVLDALTGAGRDAAGLAEVLLGFDDTEAFSIPALGAAPAGLDPTERCAARDTLTGDRVEQALCTAEVGGVVGPGGDLESVELTVGLVEGAEVPPRLQLRLDGGATSDCTGQLDVHFVPDGAPIVSADSRGCNAPPPGPELVRHYTTDVAGLFLGTTTRPLADAIVTVAGDEVVVTVPTPTGDANLDGFLQAGRRFETLDVGIGAGLFVEGIRLRDVAFPG